MFTDKQLKQIQEKGISGEAINVQIQNFKEGFPFAEITKAARLENGITKLTKQETKELNSYYDECIINKKVVKFVPASGAASRMFKDLFQYIENNKNDDKAGNDFFNDIKKFAFYNLLKETGDKNPDLKENLIDTVKCLLLEEGLNYGNLPKALLQFHKYEDHTRTPIEEHIVEAAKYGSSNGQSNIHFTVSPEHIEVFTKHIAEVKPKYEEKFGVKFNIEYSIQKPETDTIAVDMNNSPFTEENGELLFRPGGHGALIENLNEIDADIVFIKNIDNVVPDRLKKDTFLFKKAIGGLLIKIQKQIFSFLKKMEEDSFEQTPPGVIQFIDRVLCYSFPESFYSIDTKEQAGYVKNILNRPLRICGMVKNEGEPGGGPFFVKHEKGSESLQIVESAQIDLNNLEKKEILQSSSHFNPVDLVLAVKDYKGNKFNLKKFIDYKTGFISEKTKNGKKLKAQELPGLWNGAMAFWNTIFVEVPITTFNPVKTVFDLLREQHR